MVASTAPSRRGRLRAQTLAEIRQHGYAQIAEGGPTALSLNGIAKAMGMSGPGLYRYFASRDELLATLVTESYEDLADALENAAQQARRRAPEARLRTVADAFRAWALAQPHRYRLVFGSTYGSGELEPARIIPAAHRSMGVLLRALADLTPEPAAPTGDTILRRQLAEWAANRPDNLQLEPDLLALGMLGWTRMHGVISMEIEGIFEQMGIDPARLYRAEIEHLIAQRVGRG